MTDHSDTPLSSQPGKHRQGKAARPGTIVDMRDTGATKLPGPNALADKDTPKAPPVESTLVGQGAGLPPMARRAGSAPDADAPAREHVAVTEKSVPAVEKASAAPTTADHAGPFAVGTKVEDTKATSPLPEPAPASARSPEPARDVTPAPRRGGVGTMLLGGALAASLGAGAAWLALPRLPADWQPAPSVDPAAITEQARAAAVEAVADATGSMTERLRADAETAGRAAAETTLAAQAEAITRSAAEAGTQAGTEAARRLISEAPTDGAPDPVLAATVAAQAERLQQLDQTIASLTTAGGTPAPADPGLAQRVDELARAVGELSQRPALNAADIERLNALAASAEDAQSRISAAADAAAQRLQQAEDGADKLRQAADNAARQARVTAAAAALGDALQSGAPRALALGQLQEAGVTPPAALTADAPSLEELSASFAPAARAAVRADLRSEAASGEGSAIGNFLRAQTGARSVTPRAGTDADAVLSRAGDAVARGDIPGALTEIAALPEAARPAMAEWTAQAQLYADAQAALTKITAQPAVPSPAPASAAPAEAPAAAPTTAPSPSASSSAAPSTAPAN